MGELLASVNRRRVRSVRVVRVLRSRRGAVRATPRRRANGGAGGLLSVFGREGRVELVQWGLMPAIVAAPRLNLGQGR